MPYECKRILDVHWPGNRVEPNEPRYQTRMRYIQLELIAERLPEMDADTKARAIDTMRYLEAEGV